MDNKQFKNLVEAVKKDPALLHTLAFKSEKTPQETARLVPEASRTVLAGLQAENLIAHAFGIVERERDAGCGCTQSNSCGITTNCDKTQVHSIAEAAINPAVNYARYAGGLYGRINPGDFNSGCGADVTCSCTSGTCGGDTCGGSTCSVTCSGDSCGNTCGNSCSNTSNYRFDPLERERLIAQQLNRALVWR